MRPKANLVIGIMVAAAALMATPVVAQGGLPTSCNTSEGGDGIWEITALGGPCPVVCGGPYFTATGNLACDAAGTCTGTYYGIDGSPGADHVAILARGTVMYAGSEGVSIANRCEGDPSVTGLGEGTCHETTIRYNSEGFKNGAFVVVVDGNRNPSTTSVAVKKGNKGGSCEIISAGELLDVVELGNCVPSCGNFDPNQTITKTEILDFKGCKLVFEFDLDTGEIVEVKQHPLNDVTCDFIEFDVNELDVTVPGSAGGTVTMTATFGDGFISAGDDSCSCRVFAGRVYCWGSPCPDYPN
jgi:hypothetical protein